MGFYATGSLPAQTDPRPKNRVVGSRRFAPDRARRSAPQPLETTSETTVTVTITVSGLPFWPSRDPIEEQGGVNLYGFVFNNPLFYIDPDGAKPTAPPVYTPPTPAKLAACLAKCALMDIIGDAYDKAFQGAKLCGKIKNHCALEQSLPSPGDVVDGNLNPGGSKWAKAGKCLLKCLKLTGPFDVKADAKYSGKGGSISCNNGAQSVDYSFDITVTLKLDPGGHVLKEETKTVTGSCGGPLGKLTWCHCCQ